MRHRILLGLMLLLLSQHCAAVILKIDLLNDSSHSAIWPALAHLNGAIDRLSGAKALYSEDDFTVSALVIDTSDSSIDLSDSATFSGYDALILIGSAKNNREASIELLGYGVASRIVTIHNIKTPEDIEISSYRYKEGTRTHIIAERIVRDIVTTAIPAVKTE